MHLVVDGANVVGSRPDGWWKDRAGAASRLAAELAAAVAGGALEPLRACDGAPDTGLRVVLVLEGAARRAAPLPADGVEIVLAAADGDSAIVELAHDLTGRDEDVLVVTADRELSRLLHAVGARTVRPGALLALLP
ncbi:MAG: hypothetical protein OJJ54_08335 [Pseudonocardia sp.]|nr:hypothetical protein [Pseudonocardia sp.]